MSRLASLAVAAAGPLAFAACAASLPTGPNVLVLPDAGKDLARFQQEDSACRNYAQQLLGIGSPQQAANRNTAGETTAGLQQRYDMAYLQCMAASGNKVPTTATGEPYLITPYAYPAWYGYPYYDYYGPYFGGAISLGFFGHRHFDHFHHFHHAGGGGHHR